MSKLIKMTDEYKKNCLKDFEKALSMARISDGKLNFTKTFESIDRKAKVQFAPEAFAKMVMLITEFNQEVAWHGAASRVGEDEQDQYLISDIMVYPQAVTGSSVEMDTEAYAKWLQDNVEDERFNHIRMQGHSHVNMAPHASSVDLTHQEEILHMLGDDDFYIFMIWNKSFDHETKIYDMRKNILFEDKDISVGVTGGKVSFEEFIADAKSMVKPRMYGSGSLAVRVNEGVVTTTQGTTTKSSGKGSKKKKTTLDDTWESPYDDYYDIPIGSGRRYGGYY